MSIINTTRDFKLRLEDRRSDLIAARDAWDDEYNKTKSLYDKEVEDWQDALDEICLFISDTVKSLLGRKHQGLEVDALFTGVFRNNLQPTVKVSNGRWHNDNFPLSWNFDVTLDKEGNVKKETGSWSGLRATSLEDVQQLKDTVDALEILNNLDWNTILSDMEDKYPHWEDYVKTKVPDKGTRPDFESDIRLLDIEDAVGKPVLIKGKCYKYDSRFSRCGESYYVINKKTPKQLSVTECSRNSVEKFKEKYPEDSLFDIVTKYGEDYNISVDKFLKLLPNTIEFVK